MAKAMIDGWNILVGYWRSVLFACAAFILMSQNGIYSLLVFFFDQLK